MAFEITEDTYPVAVAIFGSKFAVLPFVEVEHFWVIINELGSKRTAQNKLDRLFDNNDSEDILTLINFWIPPDTFYEYYQSTKEQNPLIGLHEVIRIKT